MVSEQVIIFYMFNIQEIVEGLYSLSLKHTIRNSEALLLEVAKMNNGIKSTTQYNKRKNLRCNSFAVTPFIFIFHHLIDQFHPEQI